MKNTKNLLIAAAVTGALTGLPLVSFAATLTPMPGPSVDKLGCHGTTGKKDKQGCNAKEQGKKKDKSACAGKDGCGGKDKHE